MAGKKVANSNTVVRIDNTAGALKDITAFVRSIGGIDRAWDSEDITAFSDSETRQIKVFPRGTEVTLEVMYDTGSSSPDVFFRALANQGGTSAVHTVEIKPDGTRLVTMEAFLSRYSYIVRNKLIVGTEAVFMSDGAVTLASTS